MVRRLPDRAVAVVVDGDRLLVMRRQRDGRHYVVLPGGGVEPGEDPAAACLRELREETGLHGEVARRLWTIEHADRTAHYFLVYAAPGDPVLGGPETAAQSASSRYEPGWALLADLPGAPLRPEGLVDRLVTLR